MSDCVLWLQLFKKRVFKASNSEIRASICCVFFAETKMAAVVYDPVVSYDGYTSGHAEL